MKNLIIVGFLLIFTTTSCQESIQPIKSFKEAPAFVEKYVGIPTRLDTSFYTCSDMTHETVKKILEAPSLVFRYENRPDLNYEKLQEIFSAGFYQPIYISENTATRKFGGISILYKSERDTLYKIQFGEFTKKDGSKINVIILRDDQYELNLQNNKE